MDLNAARELFETSQDLTVGIEEEWAIIDPQTLELVPSDAGAVTARST